MKLIIQYTTVLIFISLLSNCHSQNKELDLTNGEINEVLTSVDTLNGNMNYHVLLKVIDNKSTQIHIWINDRLGELMFKDDGINICRFYPLNKSHVFVYQDNECDINVPKEMLREITNDPYEYITKSPFYKENGFYEAFIIEKVGVNLKRTALEISDEDDIDKELKELLGY